MTLKDFEELIKAETYGNVKDKWQEEANKARQNHPAMKEMKSILQPKIFEEIKAQRFAVMEKGTQFFKYRRDGGGRERNRLTYCKLDASHKILHHKDINEGDDDPSYEDLLKDENSIPVSNIEGIFFQAILLP